MQNQEVEKIILAHNPYARATNFSPIVRIFPKIPRNTNCPLLNKKFKKCCGASGQDFCNKAKENLETHLNDLKSKND